MIIISPWAKQLRNGQHNPKSPKQSWWRDLIAQLDDQVVQVGVDGELQLVDDFRKNLSLSELSDLVLSCRTWVSVDSFFQHFAWDLEKYGVVVWGQSDPNIFGHPENINVLKDRSMLMPNQFLIWEQIPYREDCFVDPQHVASLLRDK